ncbi:SusC/RagA family TonB-linked outer membrane protein [Sinomicrobium pectinilyticum]|uniref:SusC/RagA family TonB-linked outer membrane protein n=1 Tax=Sinomicrobium pectinilyticum TaxID=1084421 RepID=A0A3N0EIZ8_SINP1|nr:SusC/RagA family TonB-linked outer membrane protein [Sinomicrobium pectinilyticum]RNL87865.1 SusC/RagA family TonB-linked outer membrane protein [Sinomicrobium pectinilyticum]
MKKIIMRFRAGILFMGIFWLSAGFSVKAENRQSDLDKIKISVSFLEIHLAEALEAIGEKSNLGITFNDADIRQDKKISYKAINTSAQKILKDVLRGTGLHFRLHGENIIIYKDQEQTIEGKVYDSGIDEPLMGATISVPETGSGTTSGFNGEFSLQADNFPVKIRIAYLGYETREITVSSPVSDLEIMLVPVNEELKEVVVTALGISREEKSLGYAVGEVSGISVNESKRMNITNALAGKVAGVQIRNVSSDPGSSSLITIRGASSINGDNQPLFVIDGIPVNSNNQNAESSGEGYVDYGNTSMDISPDDIAEITVLKGAAAALYGSRAANGVILITTKKGRNGKKGLGISYNSAVKIDKAWLYPDFQNEFAAGSDILAVDENGIPVATGTATWGPRIEPGVQAVQTLPGGKTTVAELRAYPDRYKDFFDLGYTLTNNISVTGNYDKGSFRLSYTNLQNEGIVPGTNYKKNGFNLNSIYKISDDLSVSAMANFSIADSDNRPTQGKSGESDNATEVIYRLTPNTNIKDYKSYWEEGLEGLQQKTLDGGDNPYFTAFEQRNQFHRNRLFGKLQLNYKINETMNLQFRSGIDTYQEQRVTKRAFSSLEFPNGAYGNKVMGFTETNLDALFTYTPEIEGDFDASISAGANRMDQKQYYTRAFSGQLEIPQFYNISNAAAGSVENSDGHSRKRINSVYGLMQLAYGDFLFLDLSARNDWSSTLPPQNNSYFYPSASLSFIFSEAFHLNSRVFSFGRFRMSWSEVGNDTSPYQLTNTYGFDDWGDLKLAQNNQTLKNNHLKPEKTRVIELGFDLRWLQNRLGLDVALYRNKTFNQIISLPIAQSSGGTSKVINAGEIQNQGIEITLNAAPVKSSDFSWDLSANFSKNENKVNALYGDMESIQLGSATGIYQRLYVNGAIGDFYDQRTPLRVASGPDKGRYILEDGMFVRDNSWVKTGNSTPDFTMGMTNIFNYKNFRLAFTVDWSQGGEFYNYTAKNLMSDGRIGFTTAYRDPQSGGLSFEYAGMPRTDGAVIPGVILNEDGTYRENDVALPAPYYYGEYWDYEEFHMSTATYIKLRELSFGYTFRNIRWADNLSVDLIGNDLISWFAYKTKHNRDGFVTGDYDKGYDPETQNYLSSAGPLGITQGVSAWQLPATRSIGIKLSANF